MLQPGDNYGGIAKMIKDRLVVVTGASSGIGAREFRNSGDTIFNSV